MSKDLIASAENLLSLSQDPNLNEVLKDYVLEKRFMKLIQDLDDNSRLKEICQDRDEWERQHCAAFTGYWNPEMYFASFDKVKVSYMPDDNSMLMNLHLSRKDNHCGNTYYDERYLEVFKEWFFAEDGQKPWLTYWRSEFILETKTIFETLVPTIFPEEKLSWFYSLLGVSAHFFDSAEELIMKKIHRFQNFNYFLSKAKAERLEDIYPTLINFAIVWDPTDAEDGTTTLATYLTSLDKFDPVTINKILKEVLKEQEDEKRILEKEKKNKELAKLVNKFSNTDLNELEQLFKLKKELNK